MHSPRFVRLAALTAAALMSPLWLTAQPFPLGPDDGIVFDQVGFDFGGGFAYPYSHWGGLWVTPGALCERTPLRRGYVNVATERGWVVQNLLVDCQERLISEDPIAAYFELKDRNDHTTPVEQVRAGVELSSLPRLQFASNSIDLECTPRMRR